MLLKFKDMLLKFQDILFFSNFIEKIKKIQEDKFRQFDLDRQSAIQLISNIKNEYPFLNREMSSEHELIFSALSLNNKYKFKNILEIGTHDGANAFLLSKLFPSSKIMTWDLDEKNSYFINSYNRANKIFLKKFLLRRNKIIKLNKNIIFKKKNSLFLAFEKKEFDLIWIDGSHGYPMIAFDIINCLRLCNRKSIILIDDIYLNKISKYDSTYNSNGGLESLEQLKHENVIKYELFFKRINIKNNIFKKKFIAIVKKNK